jgi:N-acyl-D-amino-acid deacylase
MAADSRPPDRYSISRCKRPLNMPPYSFVVRLYAPRSIAERLIFGGSIAVRSIAARLRLPLLVFALFAYPIANPAAGEGIGYIHASLQPFEHEIELFLAKHQVRAASVAVATEDHIVMTRGYGTWGADDSQKVAGETVFRIASVSKPITAVAILKLIQDGRLDLDDRICRVLELDSYRDRRWEEITVEMLLEHRGGWDRDASFDPMFQSVRFAESQHCDPPASADAIISAMLDQPLDFSPGEQFAYSNFGYCLLGRIIERVSGRSYEDYVRSEILQPIGAGSMRIGHTLLRDRFEDEVTYDHDGSGPSVFVENLGKPVPQPYGAWYLEAMDSHGGWVASAGDLVRFGIALRPGGNGPLDDERLRRMHQSPRGLPESDVYCSLGWYNRTLDGGRMNHWHAGSLPGTTAILIRRHDGKTFAAILNTRQSEHTENLGGDLDAALHRAASRVISWPKPTAPQ